MTVPEPIRRVEGCDCGGLGQHTFDCALLDLPAEQVMARIDAAQMRVAEFLSRVPHHRRPHDLVFE